MDWLVFIPAFVLGTVVGSFLNVLIYRLPKEQSIIQRRSYCPHCETPIPFYRNIPIFSFILQRGKCAVCGRTISLQYPAVEILTGILWGVCFSLFPLLQGTLTAVLCSILIVLAWIDMQIMMVPLSLLFAALVIITLELVTGVLNWETALWGGMTGTAVPVLMMGLTYLFTKRQGLGWGDVQLGFILGAWLGPVRLLLTLFFAAGLGLIVWIGISIFRGFDSNRPLPFTPYLVFGALIVFFAGGRFAHWIEQISLNVN